MRIVQALHWLRDTMGQIDDNAVLIRRLKAILEDPKNGGEIREDLVNGLSKLPGWMQDMLRPILAAQNDTW